MKTQKELLQTSSLASLNAPPVLDAYTDYRLYLKDWYEHRKGKHKSAVSAYSYSHFSAAADIKSPNYLKLIIEGKRNLSLEMIRKFARALQLNKAGAIEFAVLVQYCQADEPLVRNRFLKQLSDMRIQKQMQTGQIKKKTWEQTPNWVTWLIYAMAEQEGVEFQPEAMQRLIRRQVSVEEIRKSLEKLLLSGDLIKEFQTGEIKKGRQLMEGSENVPKELIRKLQAELTYLGLESLFQAGSEEREFGAFTMALTEEEFKQVRFEVRQLRKRLYKEYSVKRESSKGERVFQMNIQLFPLTDNSK